MLYPTSFVDLSNKLAVSRENKMMGKDGPDGSDDNDPSAEGQKAELPRYCLLCFQKLLITIHQLRHGETITAKTRKCISDPLGPTLPGNFFESQKPYG